MRGKAIPIIILITAIAVGLLAGYHSGPAPEQPSETTINLLGVDENGEGILVPVTVMIMPGTGRILVNIDNPSFIVDTQESMRNAVLAAAKHSGKNPSEYNYVFSMYTNIKIIGGPSAGAQLAGAIVSLHEGKELDPDTYITGGIKEDGTITPVGGILEKAGILTPRNTLIVPQGQSVYRQAEEKCETVMEEDYYRKQCLMEYKTLHIHEETGVTVIEVQNLAQAMEKMLK